VDYGRCHGTAAGGYVKVDINVGDGRAVQIENPNRGQNRDCRTNFGGLQVTGDQLDTGRINSRTRLDITTAPQRHGSAEKHSRKSVPARPGSHHPLPQKDPRARC
jgi:hypothetical protein